MAEIRIVSDSSCDLPDYILEESNITMIPFYVSFDKENYKKERIDITPDEFYHNLEEEKIFPKTSMPSVQDYMDAYTNLVKEGHEVLCITISSQFSGSNQAANNAKTMLLDDYPDAKITVIDSKLCSGGQGLLVLEALRMVKANLALDEIETVLNKIKKDGRIHFTVDTLEYLQKGGRIGKASALAGSILNVKPLISMADGELTPYGIVRGRKKAIKKLVEMTQTDIQGKNIDDYHFCVGGVKCFDEIEKLEKLLNEVHIYPEPPMCQIGATIGTYSGSSAVGMAYIPKYETCL